MTLKENFENIIYNYIGSEWDRRDVSNSLENDAEEFAIGFAFYLSDNYISRTLDTWDDAVGIRFTTKEVLEIYKKEKGL